ncbi:hypothetical protein AB0395_27805 [Streptosporangium sp. NPDC051023]
MSDQVILLGSGAVGANTACHLRRQGVAVTVEGAGLAAAALALGQAPPWT